LKTVAAAHPGDAALPQPRALGELFTSFVAGWPARARCLWGLNSSAALNIDEPPTALHIQRMTDANVKGSCLCGGVGFEIVGKTGPIGQCHCSKCRKVSGTDGNAVFYARAEQFRWLRGEELIRTFLLPQGNGWRSTFCCSCGSPLPHTDNANKVYFVPAGLLDDDPGHRGYAAHIFVGSKAPWSVLADDAPKYEEGFGSARADETST
jgi:hypothetical protein